MSLVFDGLSATHPRGCSGRHHLHPPRRHVGPAPMEISLATVIALALCGRPAHRVLGARQWPTEAHAWVWTENGVFGLSGRDRVDLRRPWAGALVAPPVPKG
ncbi:hypothetical protein B9S66_31025 (plasmid) [Streptomyces sp. SM17]|nr:hypothetical protein B9S66_31025 [Streptomyces sp. SM17]